MSKVYEGCDISYKGLYIYIERERENIPYDKISYITKLFLLKNTEENPMFYMVLVVICSYITNTSQMHSVKEKKEGGQPNSLDLMGLCDMPQPISFFY